MLKFWSAVALPCLILLLFAQVQWQLRERLDWANREDNFSNSIARFDRTYLQEFCYTIWPSNICPPVANPVTCSCEYVYGTQFSAMHSYLSRSTQMVAMWFNESNAQGTQSNNVRTKYKVKIKIYRYTPTNREEIIKAAWISFLPCYRFVIISRMWNLQRKRVGKF